MNEVIKKFKIVKF